MFQGLEGNFSTDNPTFWIMIAIQFWELPWKGFALWKAARNKHTGWFLALLLIHLAGLIDILYIFYFSEAKKRPTLKIIKKLGDKCKEEKK